MGCYLDEQERLRVQQRADMATSLGAVKSGPNRLAGG